MENMVSPALDGMRATVARTAEREVDVRFNPRVTASRVDQGVGGAQSGRARTARVGHAEQHDGRGSPSG